YAGNLNDDHVKYAVENAEGSEDKAGAYNIPDGGHLTLTLSGNLTDAIKIKKIYNFTPQSYLVKLNIELSAPLPDGSSFWLEWNRFSAHIDTNARLNHIYFTTLDPDNKVKHVQLSEVTAPIVELGQDLWISY